MDFFKNTKIEVLFIKYDTVIAEEKNWIERFFKTFNFTLFKCYFFAPHVCPCEKSSDVAHIRSALLVHSTEVVEARMRCLRLPEIVSLFTIMARRHGLLFTSVFVTLSAVYCWCLTDITWLNDRRTIRQPTMNRPRAEERRFLRENA